MLARTAHCIKDRESDVFTFIPGLFLRYLDRVLILDPRKPAYCIPVAAGFVHSDQQLLT